MESIRFEQGWGVEIAMLIDIATMNGSASIGQVDLGSRNHRHRDLQSLSVQAAEVMATMLDRAGAPAVVGDSEALLRRADGSAVPLNLATRPSLADMRRSDIDVREPL